MFALERDNELGQGLKIEFAILLRDRCNDCTAIADFDAFFPDDSFDPEAVFNARRTAGR